LQGVILKFLMPREFRKCQEPLTRESVLYRGPRLFDSLPSALRQMEDVNLLGFKRKLDNWLAKVLDQPTVRGLCRASPTNSIIDQVKYMC
jgi:hypothetical protein